jgi:midasin
MLLGERLRDDAEKKIVLSVLEDRFGAKIDTEQLYGSDVEAAIAHAKLGSSLSGIAPTRSLGRLLKLVSRCVEYREPVLLVGETGSGKTTVCQLLSAILQKDLRMVNCHQSTEAADLLGSLRPLRGRAALASQLSRLSREFIATCNSVTDSKPATTLEVSFSQLTPSFLPSSSMMVSPPY